MAGEQRTDKVISLVQDLKIALQEEMLKLKELTSEVEVKKRSWEEAKLGKVEKVHFPSKIKLDVGGKLFATSLSTLMSIGGTFFSAMFSGSFKFALDKDGSYFIDRDPLVFPIVLNFLRGTPPDFKNITPREFVALVSDAEYYQLDDLSAIINEQAKKRRRFKWLPEASCVLSNEDYTVRKTMNINSWNCKVLGEGEWSSGIHTWEITFDTINSDRSGMVVGLCRKDQSSSDFSSAIGFGMSGNMYGGVTQVGSSLVTSARKVKIVADFDLNKIDLFADGALAATGSIPSKPLCPCAFIYYGDQLTLNEIETV